MAIPISTTTCPTCKERGALQGGEINRDGWVEYPECANGCSLSDEDLADIALNTEWEWRDHCYHGRWGPD